MNTTIILVVVLLGIFIGLPVALLLARDSLTRPSKKKIEAYSREFIQRLQHPDYAAVAKYFGRPLPECVRTLYANKEELMLSNFAVAASAAVPEEDRWYVSDYQPADGPSVQDAWPGLEKYFAFADDGAGNGYLIDPAESDPPVLFHDHETGELSRVSDRFTEFMRWPRFEVKG
jgi:hypothetical protein